MKQFVFVAFALCLVAVQASTVKLPAQDKEDGTLIDLPLDQFDEYAPYIAEFLHLGASWKCVKTYKKAGQLITEKIRPHLGEIEHCFGHNANGNSIDSILDFLTSVLVEKQQCINKKFLSTVKNLVKYHRTIQKLRC